MGEEGQKWEGPGEEELDVGAAVGGRCGWLGTED